MSWSSKNLSRHLRIRYAKRATRKIYCWQRGGSFCVTWAKIHRSLASIWDKECSVMAIGATTANWGSTLNGTSKRYGYSSVITFSIPVASSSHKDSVRCASMSSRLSNLSCLQRSNRWRRSGPTDAISRGLWQAVRTTAQAAILQRQPNKMTSRGTWRSDKNHSSKVRNLSRNRGSYSYLVRNVTSASWISSRKRCLKTSWSSQALTGDETHTKFPPPFRFGSWLLSYFLYYFIKQKNSFKF